MIFSKEQALALSNLAKIKIDDESLEEVTSDIKKILNMVNKLEEVKCDDIEPLYHPLEDITPYYRPDTVDETNKRELLQKNSPATSSGLYLVPQVIE